MDKIKIDLCDYYVFDVDTFRAKTSYNSNAIHFDDQNIITTCTDTGNTLVEKLFLSTDYDINRYNLPISEDSLVPHRV